jgi:hypothetical protein
VREKRHYPHINKQFKTKAADTSQHLRTIRYGNFLPILWMRLGDFCAQKKSAAMCVKSAQICVKNVRIHDAPALRHNEPIAV